MQTGNDTTKPRTLGLLGQSVKGLSWIWPICKGRSLLRRTYGLKLYYVVIIYVPLLDSQFNLKLYCGYKYTRTCMINRIWSLKQLWILHVLVNGHHWFHLHGIHWAVRNRLRLKNSKWRYVSSEIRTHASPCHDARHAISALDCLATTTWWRCLD